MERLPSNSHNGLLPIEIGIQRALGLLTVQSGLTIADKTILRALIQKKIKDYDGKEAADKLAQMLEFIKYDIGYTPKDKNEWSYQRVRIVQLVCTYYGDMTVEDFKTAFEMLVIGELDEYIPTAERKHYGQFTPDYVSKVLKAYKRRQNAAITATIETAERQPETPKEYTEEQQAEGDRFVREVCAAWYDLYLATGKLPNSDTRSTGIIAACLDALAGNKTEEADKYAMYYQLVAQRLERAGRFTRRPPSEENRKKAYNEYIRSHNAGRRNDYEAAHVRKLGHAAPELDFLAQKYADLEEIRRAFSQLHEKGIINICDVI